jgi:hypothetical protein
MTDQVVQAFPSSQTKTDTIVANQRTLSIVTSRTFQALDRLGLLTMTSIVLKSPTSGASVTDRSA